MFQNGKVKKYDFKVYKTNHRLIKATSVRGPFAAHMVSMSSNKNLLERT